MFKLKTSAEIREQIIGKTAAYNLQRDPEQWNAEIRDLIEKEFPFISDSITAINWDDEHSNFDVGFALGEVVAGNNEVVITLPFVIKNYSISPFDMYVYKDKYYPAKSEDLQSILFNAGVGELGPRERYPINSIPYVRDDTGSLLQQMLTRQNQSRRMKIAELEKRLKKRGMDKLASRIESELSQTKLLDNASAVARITSDKTTIEMRIYKKGELKKVSHIPLSKFASAYKMAYKKMALTKDNVTIPYSPPKQPVDIFVQNTDVENVFPTLSPGTYEVSGKSAKLVKSASVFPYGDDYSNILLFGNNNYLDSAEDMLYEASEKKAEINIKSMTIDDINRKTLGRFMFCIGDKCYGPAFPTEVYDRFAASGRYVQIQFVMGGSYYNIIFSPNIDKIVEMDRADKDFWMRGAKNYLAPLSASVYLLDGKEFLDQGSPLSNIQDKMAETVNDGYLDINKLGYGVYQVTDSGKSVYYYKTALDVYGGLASLGYSIPYSAISDMNKNIRFYYNHTDIKKTATVNSNVKRQVQVLRKLSGELLKCAEEINDSDMEDSALGLSLISDEDVDLFIDMIPNYEEVMSKLVKLLYYSRLGLKNINEKAVENAVDSLYIVISNLKKLAVERGNKAA